MSFVPLEIQMKTIEIVKNRERMAQGAKELASYSTIGFPGAICIWETDRFENLLPLLNALSAVGVNTEVIPIQKSDVGMKYWEEGIREAMK